MPSPIELLEHALPRIEALDAGPGAFITATAERTRTAASAAEARLREGGELRGDRPGHQRASDPHRAARLRDARRDGRPATTGAALLLNATYEPLCVVSSRRAIVLVLVDKAESVDVTVEVGARRDLERLGPPWWSG